MPIQSYSDITVHVSVPGTKWQSKEKVVLASRRRSGGLAHEDR